ncbi:MAG: thioesterase [Kordia sp.]|nr:MAG: thioesterase [Kordia sp.]
MQKIKLFCLPYAGGSVTVYYKWREYLNDYVEFIPIEYRGRGQRMKEPFYTSINEGVDDVFSIIKDQIQDGNYMFFGHSMATLFLYELGHKIKDELLPPPIHMFLSGRTPPHFHKNYESTDEMSDKEFLLKLKNYGGTSKEFFESKELLQIFLPILRSDYKIVEDYDYEPKSELLNTNVSFFFSKEDSHVSMDKVNIWQDYIIGSLKVYDFEGGHFFIHDDTEKIVRIINDEAVNIILEKSSVIRI